MVQYVGIYQVLHMHRYDLYYYTKLAKEMHCNAGHWSHYLLFLSETDLQSHKQGGPAHTMGYQSTWMTNPNCSMAHYSRYEDHYPWHKLPSITED